MWPPQSVMMVRMVNEESRSVHVSRITRFDDFGEVTLYPLTAPALTCPLMLATVPVSLVQPGPTTLHPVDAAAATSARSKPPMRCFRISPSHVVRRRSRNRLTAVCGEDRYAA